jgi:ABC-type spermidine/putrescine transport system permease subunit II
LGAVLAGASGGIIPFLYSLQEVNKLVFSSQAAISARTTFPLNILFAYDRISTYLIIAVSAILFLVGIIYMVRALLQKDLQKEQPKEAQV